MIKKFSIHGLVAACALASGVGAANAAQLDISVTNLSHGSYFTPLLISAHDSSTHLFQAGTVASDSLKAMAECGDTSLLLTDLSAADNLDNPAGGFLAPGDSTTGMLSTMQGHLSLVAMILPSNDGFVGLDSLAIPTTAGTYTYYLNAWDAGSEANSETFSTGCAVNQPGIPGNPGGVAGTGGSGVTEAGMNNNTMVHIHRGILGDSDDAGGISDLDSRVHRWQNPIAKIVITVTP